MRDSAGDKWDLMEHWHLVLPPSRPSAAQLDRIRERLDALDRRAAVAVLGSTPEFRDLLYESGFQHIYVFDRNVKFYAAMSEARIYRNAEEFVHGDWLVALRKYEGQFSAVLSDLTSGNVSYEQRGQFYESISLSLAPGGVFVDKVLTHQSPLADVEQLIDKYSRLPLNWLYVNHFSCEMIFSSELLTAPELVDTSAIYSWLDSAVENPRVRMFVRQSKRITPSGCTWWYGRPWERLEAAYCPTLSRVSVREEEWDSPYAGRVTYFDLEKP